MVERVVGDERIVGDDEMLMAGRALEAAGFVVAFGAVETVEGVVAAAEAVVAVVAAGAGADESDDGVAVEAEECSGWAPSVSGGHRRCCPPLAFLRGVGGRARRGGRHSGYPFGAGSSPHGAGHETCTTTGEEHRGRA